MVPVLKKCFGYNKKHLYLSHSAKQRDDHDDTHELCEENHRSEEGPHRPQCNVKAAEESR